MTFARVAMNCGATATVCGGAGVGVAVVVGDDAAISPPTLSAIDDTVANDAGHEAVAVSTCFYVGAERRYKVSNHCVHPPLTRINTNSCSSSFDN